MDTDTVGPQSGPFSRLVTVECLTSTQTWLHEALTDPSGRLAAGSAQTWPHLSALCAHRQTAGRGRADRSWVTPPSGALTVSVVLRPRVPVERTAWLPLLAGLAVRDAIAPLLAEVHAHGSRWEVGTKWPNDVVVRPVDAASVAPVRGWGHWRKVAGILTDLVLPDGAVPGAQPAPAPLAVPAPLTAPAVPPGRDPEQPDETRPAGGSQDAGPDRAHRPAVIVGIGVNVAQPPEDLPVDWAASLATTGLSVAVDDVLMLVGHELRAVVEEWEALGGDPDAGDGGLGRRLRATCFTLGEQVEAVTPAGRVAGRAVALQPGLVLSTPHGLSEITAGDVTRLRKPDEQPPRPV